MRTEGIVGQPVDVDKSGADGRGSPATNRYSRKALLLFAVVVALRVASPFTASASYVVVGGYALSGRRQAVEALFVSWLLTMLSEGIAPAPVAGPLFRILLIGFAAGSVFLHPPAPATTRAALRPVRVTLAFGGLVALHSLLFSATPDVSVIKIVLWTITVVTLLSACIGMSNGDYDTLTVTLFGGLIVVFVVSIPLVRTSLGFLRNGSGFQGILVHPQTFGPAMAVLGAWLAAGVFGAQEMLWRRALLLGGVMFAILLSEARTAGLALLLGVSIAVLASLVAKGALRRAARERDKARRRSLMFLTVFSLVAAAPLLSDRVDRYFSKGTSATSILDAYDTSRGRLIRIMSENIRAHPFRGIGFGVASDTRMAFVLRESSAFSSTTRSVEKGVLPLAVIEELGAPFALAALFWFGVMVTGAIRAGFVQAAVSITALLTNMAESSLFSVGGLGLLLLIALSWAVGGASRHRDPRKFDTGEFTTSQEDRLRVPLS